MSRREVAALQEVLAAEHAVVFGYGVAGARLDGAERRRAQRSWNGHRAARDELAAHVVALGGEPEAAAATYALPSPVGSAADARDLVVLLEERLAATWADAVTALAGDLRALAVEGLRDASVAGARWRGSSVAFPGLAERAGP
jgi:hypothetical protein